MCRVIRQKGTEGCENAHKDEIAWNGNKKFLFMKSCLNYIWDVNSLAKESIREGGNNNFVI